MHPDIARLRQLLQRDLYAFAARCFAGMNPNGPLIPADYMRVIAAKLQDCMEGKVRRLVINVPPRQMKSIMASVALPAFWLGHRPSDHIMCVSYAQDLSEVFSRYCRQVMSETWYQQVFGTRLSTAKNAINEFTTTRGGSRVATSVGGIITGRGADVVIIDDPMKPEDALSDRIRDGVNDWYRHTLMSRLNNKQTGCMILVMQRLHENDLTGFVLEGEEWEVLSFPAIAEQDEEYTVQTPMGPLLYSRKIGTVLNPRREDLKTIEAMRATLGEYDFQSQYQQDPIPRAGLIVKREWFPFYRLGDLPEKFDRTVQSWDTANKVGELNDYSVCTTWGVKGNRNYLLNVLRKKMEFPDLKRAVFQQQELFNADVVLIEDKASGTQLIQELRHSGMATVKGYNPGNVDKQMRLHTQTPTLEGGFVLLPENAAWLDAYLTEMTSFPGGKHDDQVDSTTQFLEWIKSGSQYDGMIRYLQDEVDKQQQAG